MAIKAPYKTRQMTELITFLKSVQGDHVTVSDICAHFQKEGVAVGITTIYRNLEKMVREGLVAKHVIAGTGSACFEYVGEKTGCEQPICCHCICEKCGKLVHLQCSEVESLHRHMLEHHGFETNALRTVFYGVCGECKETVV